jgi:hypothetical protein
MAISGAKTVNTSKNEKEEKQKTYDILTPDNYRKAYVNDRGDVTEIDDDTAKILFENPKFYSTLYDSGRGTHVPANMLRWCDELGSPTELVVGEKYERKDF